MQEKIEGKVTPEALEVIYLDEIASRLMDLQAIMGSLELCVQDIHETQKAEITEDILEGAEMSVIDQIKPVNITNKKIRHVPYHVTRTLGIAEEKRERIAEDKIKGLRTVGRAGYISNSGPGSIEIKIFDGKEWGDWITIASEDGINFYYEDNIWLHTMRVKASKTTRATYELAVNPGLGGE